MRGWRVAAVPVDSRPGLHSEVAVAYAASLERLRAAGLDIEMVTPAPPWSEAFEPTTVLMAGEGWRCWRERVQRHEAEMDPSVVKRLRVGEAITDAQLVEALARRVDDQARAYAWLAPYRALLMPTCPIPAPPLDEVDETTSPLSSLTRAANYLDLPAASVPAGLTEAGMPIGLQIVGGPQNEHAVVALAAAFERVSGWNGRRPPEWAGPQP